MDWQEIIALTIVAATAVWLLKLLFQRPKLGGSPCGHCPAAGGSSHPPSFVLQQRKNEPVRVLIKS